MPAAINWGDTAVLFMGAYVTQIKVLPSPRYAVDPSADDPARTFALFPPLEQGQWSKDESKN